ESVFPGDIRLAVQRPHQGLAPKRDEARSLRSNARTRPRAPGLPMPHHRPDRAALALTCSMSRKERDGQSAPPSFVSR
nr:hypothetical protein [Tanacetum cinerariifolium]